MCGDTGSLGPLGQGGSRGWEKWRVPHGLEEANMVFTVPVAVMVTGVLLDEALASPLHGQCAVMTECPGGAWLR